MPGLMKKLTGLSEEDSKNFKLVLTKKYIMYKLTHKLTGHSFKLSFVETAEFFYKKNANGEYINLFEDYQVEEVKKIDILKV